MPVPPNQRRKTASVMTLPSGDGEGVSQTGIVLVGDRGVNMLDGATFSLDGVAVAYAPGAAQWLPTTPAYTEIFIPANAGPHTVKVVLQNRVVKQKTGVQVYFTTTASVNRTRVLVDGMQEPAVLSLFQEHRSVTIDGVEREKPEKTGSPSSFRYTMPDVSPTHNIIVDVDDTHRYSFPNYYIMPGTSNILQLTPAFLISTRRTNITSFSDVDHPINLDGNPGPGDIFSITGVPSDVVGLIVQENGRVLSGTLAGGTWTAEAFDASDAAVISVQPQTAGTAAGIPNLGRALTRTVAIPAAGLSIAYSTLAAPTTQYRRVGEGGTGSLTVTGEPGWVVALAASGSTTPIAASPIPSSGSISIPVPVGSYNLGVQNANGVRAQSITVTSTGLTVDTRTFAATPAPPAMTGIVLVGDIGSIGGATFSLDGVAVPYAPGAAQWLPTTPAYTKLFIPAPAGAHVVRLIKGGDTLMANATVAAGQVTEIPVSNMTVETRSTTQQVTNSNTGIVLVGDIGSIGGAVFSLDGVAVPYALGAAQWLPTTPAYTKLFIPAPAGAHVVRLIKGGETRRADAAVASGQVTEIPVTGMQQELVEIQKSEDPKVQKSEDPFKSPTPLELRPPVVTVGPIEVFPDARFRQPTDEERRRDAERRQPAPQPGMSTTSKLIIGGLVAAALGGGYYWYSMQPKANPGKKDCGCGCKGGCGG